ncbi:N-Acetylneuraminate cytidylyltransferase [Enhygromyxa salina]|uniref:N-Acetylneuraminate cytidylyltransferase n=1 Tax=Enhygromyxa salina TaxID=215803 RepID=A0A0C1ZSB0_9BACT|nr:GNAT family N-acetyltransferase [Enhygromyxa salina]KIG13968.1 N-Acetylneuraminate cytidylyltransferase [Enhygromyxa salina]
MAELRFRPALPADAELVYRWANDPVTRAASFSNELIGWDQHLAWFTAQLGRDDRHPFVVEVDGAPVAFVRLDASAAKDGLCTISVNVAPEARGRGLGVGVLRAATPIAAGLGFAQIEALIRPDNHASQRAFVRAGYEQSASVVVNGEPALRYLEAT